jgi:hypothetical protein
VDLVEQLVRVVEPARGFGAAARLAVSLLPLVEAGEQAGVSGIDVTGLSLHPGKPPSIEPSHDAVCS